MGKFHRHGEGTAHTHDHADHGGYATGTQRIEVLEAIMAENDLHAAANRAAFERHGVRTLNLMSSPGAGKTTVLQAALDALADEFAIGVIEGDIATDLDAIKLTDRAAQVSLLNTSNGFGGECHLDAPMVSRALLGLDLGALDLVIIENVGNLVCPAEFDVGEHAKAMVYSIPEGDDKPLKYPVMFRAVDLLLLNKIDLAPYLDADIATYIARIQEVNQAATILPISARTGAGMPAVFDWLREFARRGPQPNLDAVQISAEDPINSPPQGR
ncbi:MAG: hydrogenase nickel incorporation protein HypB [Mycobacterium sp.]